LKEEFDHIDDLIGKYLAGEASNAERDEVEGWILASDGNKVYFDQLSLIFERSKSIKENLKFDTDSAWLKVKSKLSKSQGKTVPIQRQWPLLRIAALIIIAVGIGYLVFNKVNTPDQVVQFSADNQILRDTLPDGSLTVLNKQSTIQYAYNPNNNRRNVVLKGEAFFEVKHQADKPFIIETGEVIIEDIGTSFNVNAFPDSPTIEVYVESGEVAFYTLSNKGLNLTAGETGVYHKQSQSFARLMRTDTNRLAYKTGIFNFRNADLGSIVEDLNAVYETKVQLANPALTNCRLNVTFRNERIDDIVEIIAETLKLSVTKDGDVYILNGASCGD